MRSTEMISKASMSLEVLALRTFKWIPRAFEAISASIISTQPVGLVGLTRKPIECAAGTSSRSNSRRYAVNADVRMAAPVTLPPGRPRLATKPFLMGSPPATNTIGIVVVADFAVRTRAVPPAAKITSTRRRVKFVASASKRSYRPSTQ
jgi:hypothetical protein